MFLCANCLSGFFCVCVCVCLDYSRTNEQIFIKKFVGRPDRRKKLLKERSGSYFGYKKNHEVPFQCIFNDFGFLLDISMKINYVHPTGGWTYYFCFFRRPVSHLVSRHFRQQFLSYLYQIWHAGLLG